MRHLAATDHPTEDQRAALRAALGPILEQLLHDLGIALEALDRPGPEYALSLYIDIAREAPDRFRKLEDALSVTLPLRVAG
jgi:hypothetical protein